MTTTKDTDTKVEEPKVTQAEWLADAQDATAREHGMRLCDALRLYPKAALWSLAMSSTIIMEGYDTMLMGNLYAQPAFQRRYGVQTGPNSHEIPSRWQAGLNNGSACGQLIGLLLAGYVCERFGFRKTMMGGLSAIVALIFIPFFAPRIEVLIVGQVLFGIPLGLFQTTPIIYASEISPVCLRPYLTNYVNFCWAIGHLIGAGILRGSLQLEGQWGYRVVFAIQWFWPVVLIPTLFFAPESPWWMVRQGNIEGAKRILKELASKDNADEDLDKSVSLMVVTTEHERTLNASTTYLACFRGVDLRRTLIVIGIYCAQTLSGNPLRSSSSYFMRQAGFPSAQAFNLTIMNYALAFIGGLVSWVLLPILSRRTTYVGSLALMLVLMIIIGGVGVPQAVSTNTTYSWVIGITLIVSSFLYNAAMGPLTNTLCCEIPSTLLRSKSVVLARWTYIVTTIVAGTITPYQLNPTAWNWGAKTGFFWAGGCLISVVFAYFCVPETKDRTTAEMDILFERKTSMRGFARAEVNLVEAIGGKDA
ncbi:general substrate transporter [Plectosphaerella cucumerina]|uniref:General substrate transporter n=1 Tax=Plectosphaerella cucumerina TaxID=40658 RepID=A0A8K0X619_9PEZI|nr:general substrate transporter [Plectosphaerella cucumerina]